MALYSPYPSLLKYIIGVFPNNFKKKQTRKVYGEIEITKYFVFSIFVDFTTSDK